MSDKKSEQTSEIAQATPVVFGAAGHIDHGKSALVRALTGTEPDRLAEEKRRGITIELGYAFLTDKIAFIDAPGHEKFVKNMVAGASMIDYALLVIAADDSIMPQTREHLEVLKLLKIKDGIVVITKADLVDESWLEMLREEIADYLAGSFLARAPMIAVDSLSGSGIEELRAAIIRLAAKKVTPGGGDFFRMPIDRVFQMKGFGAVVTGTVMSGRVSVDDRIEVAPSGKSVRVKGVQSQGKSVDYAIAGQRTAINLASVGVDEVSRGETAATPGLLKPSNRMDAMLELLPTAGKKLKHRTRVRVHLGTAEITARVRLLEDDVLEPGGNAFIQLALEEPGAAMRLDRFVLRSYSPMRTIGGGMILDPTAPKRKRRSPEVISQLKSLASDDGAMPLLGALEKIEPATIEEIARETNIELEIIELRLADLNRSGRVVELSTTGGKLYAREILYRQFMEAALSYLQTAHAAKPLKPGYKKAEVFAALPKRFPRKKAAAPLLDRAIRLGALKRAGGDLIAAPGFEVALDREQTELIDKIRRAIGYAALATPSDKELAERLELPLAQVKPLISYLIDLGEIVVVGGEYLFAAHRLAEARFKLTNLFKEKKELPIAEIKEALNTTRKYAVPLAGYFDSQGWTTRNGEVRVEGPKLRAGE